uniref:Uncharacterized protein n=1 Tax=Lepeophtheirus salmonis TaxID=72036 RepID=A0A0K2VE72_LEPSM
MQEWTGPRLEHTALHSSVLNKDRHNYSCEGPYLFGLI